MKDWYTSLMIALMGGEEEYKNYLNKQVEDLQKEIDKMPKDKKIPMPKFTNYCQCPLCFDEAFNYILDRRTTE